MFKKKWHFMFFEEYLIIHQYIFYYLRYDTVVSASFKTLKHLWGVFFGTSMSSSSDAVVALYIIGKLRALVLKTEKIRSDRGMITALFWPKHHEKLSRSIIMNRFAKNSGVFFVLFNPNGTIYCFLLTVLVRTRLHIWPKLVCFFSVLADLAASIGMVGLWFRPTWTNLDRFVDAIKELLGDAHATVRLVNIFAITEQNLLQQVSWPNNQLLISQPSVKRL